MIQRIVHRLAVRLRRRVLAGQGGFTLVELLAVMIVLLIVLAPLTGSFVSSLNAQVDQTRRFDNQENARRRSTGCARTSTAPTE